MEKYDRQFNRLIEKPVEIFKFHLQKKIKILQTKDNTTANKSHFSQE